MKDVSLIPQNPTNEQIVQYLEAYTQAMCNLSAIWGNANDNQDSALCNRRYPFSKDFDGLLNEIIEWANEAKDNLEEARK